MYAPHTVTVFNSREDGLPVATILRGVFLDVSKGANVKASGMENADAATLYIPFAVEAVHAETGEKQTFVGPKEYGSVIEKEHYWTLRTSGTGGAADCFFARGEIHESGKYQAINSAFDDVFRVSTVDTKDFGTPDMQHWEVGGR